LRRLAPPAWPRALGADSGAWKRGVWFGTGPRRPAAPAVLPGAVRADPADRPVVAVLAGRLLGEPPRPQRVDSMGGAGVAAAGVVEAAQRY